MAHTRKRGCTRRSKRSLSPRHCEICGYNLVVQQHRIKPGREGGEYVEGNVISLCPNHHHQADRGIIKANLLQWIVDQRIKISNELDQQRNSAPQKSRASAAPQFSESDALRVGNVWHGVSAWLSKAGPPKRYIELYG